MNLLDELKENNGQFDYMDLVKRTEEYENATKSLINNKNYELAYKILDCYIKQFKELSKYPASRYTPGTVFVCSLDMLYDYATMMKKGINGVVDKNKEEADYAYLQLLKRFDWLPKELRDKVADKSHLLLKYAYPDLMDRYSNALYAAGNYFYKKKDFRRAFRLFKKGADFDCSGRQICYPYFLVGRNQDKVADMYQNGLGVDVNLAKAFKYYNSSAENCGRKRHPKLGDTLLQLKDYAGAFLYYTEANPNHPYCASMGFLYPTNMEKKFKMIFDGINNKPEKTKEEMCVLAMMYFAGLGVEKNVLKYEELLPKGEHWTNEWIHRYIFATLDLDD